MKEIYVSYKELKQRFLDIRKIISEITVFKENKIKLSTTINQEIGADGADAWDLLDEIQKEYGINDSNFTLTDYFSNTEPPYPIWYPFVFILFIPLYILYFLLFFLIFPISESSWAKLSKKLENLFPKYNNRKKFTVSQLVTWTYTKEFILREEVRFIFKSPEK